MYHILKLHECIPTGVFVQYPSILHTRLSYCGGAGAYFSCHWVRRRVVTLEK